MSDKRKKSFVLHIDSLDILDDLEDEQVANLFRAIKAFQNDEEPELDAMTKLVFLPFKNQFIRDNDKYEETRKRRAEAGSKGGKAKVANASKTKQKVAKQANQANLADSDSKSVSDSDSDSDSVNDKDISIRQPKVAKCPHEDIVNLYHEILPELSKVKVWTDKRQGYLRTVWNGDKKRQSMEYWQGLFSYVKQSDFLMGRANEFKADLEWIVKPANFIKIIEGKYENGN